MNNITMKDVALRAGVDVSTVSLALRDDPRIRKDTRDRIKEAAKALGYEINPLVSAWVRSRRKSTPAARCVPVAFLTCHPHGFDWKKNLHFLAIFNGLREQLEQFGFIPAVFDLNLYQNAWDRLDKILLARNIQGLVFAPANQSYSVSGLSWERYCAVTIGYALESPIVHRITEDHFLGMQLALQRCHTLGHKRVGLAFSHYYNHERLDRWTAAYLAGTQTQQEQIPVLHPDRNANNQKIKQWLKAYNPDVVLCDDPQKFKTFNIPAVCFAITESHIQIPGVFENNREIGSCAADALIALTFRNERGLPRTRKNILVEPYEEIHQHSPNQNLEEFFPAGHP